MWLRTVWSQSFTGTTGVSNPHKLSGIQRETSCSELVGKGKKSWLSPKGTFTFKERNMILFWFLYKPGLQVHWYLIRTTLIPKIKSSKLSGGSWRSWASVCTSSTHTRWVAHTCSLKVCYTPVFDHCAWTHLSSLSQIIVMYLQVLECEKNQILVQTAWWVPNVSTAGAASWKCKQTWAKSVLNGWNACRCFGVRLCLDTY